MRMRSRKLAETGVTGVVLVPPDGLGRDQQQLAAYLAALAENAPCPVILYEWPQRKPCAIDPATYRTLVAECGVRGIKDTTCTIEGIRAKIKAAPESIVYQANTPLLVDAIQLGARGVMAITSTAAADLVVECWNVGIQSHSATMQYHHQLVMLDAILRFGYPATAKYLLQLRGLPFELYCRSNVILPEEGAKALAVWWEQSRLIPDGIQ